MQKDIVKKIATALYRATKDKKKAEIDEIVGRVGGMLQRYRLTSKRPELIAALDRVRQIEEGITAATVESRYPLPVTTLKELREYINAKHPECVELTAIENPGVIGGFKVRFGDTVVDASIRSQLQQLTHHLQ